MSEKFEEWIVEKFEEWIVEKFGNLISLSKQSRGYYTNPKTASMFAAFCAGYLEGRNGY